MLIFQQVTSIVQGREVQAVQPLPVNHLLTDSRKLSQPAGTLFFAISGKFNDGHKYLATLYKQGVRRYIVEKAQDT